MGSDLIPLQARQTELTYYATVDPPAFDLGERWTELQSAIYAHLGRLSLRLNDIKIESATANPGDMSIACWMLSYGALARYRLDRVEAWSNSPRVAEDTALATDIIEQTMKVLRSVSPKSRVTLHSVNVAIHGSLAGQDAALARIASFITRRPEGSPSLTPSGVSFLCEFPLDQGHGSIILERSTLVPDGAFLRVSSEHVGSISEVEAMGRAIEFFRASTMRLGLSIVWGN